MPRFLGIKCMVSDIRDVSQLSFGYFKLCVSLVLKESVVGTDFIACTTIGRNRIHGGSCRLVVCRNQMINANWKACGLESKAKPSSLILMQVSCWDFSGYESALGIRFMVEKSNRWFSQQGFLWHQWTCWPSSGYFCVITEFLGMLTVGLEVRLPRVEASPLLALMCGWLWRCRCTCGETSYTLCCDQLCGGCSAATSQTTWAMAALALSVHAAAVPLFVLQTYPTMLLEWLLCSCGSWGVNEEEEGLSFSTRHPLLPPGLRVRCVSELSHWFCFQPVLVRMAWAGLNWEGIYWRGCLWRKGAMAEAVRPVVGAGGGSRRGQVSAPPRQAGYAAWVQNGACSAPPASSFGGTSRGLRSSSGEGGWSLGPWLRAPGSHSLGWRGRCPFNGSKTWSSAPSLIFCCCQRW